MMTPTDVGVPRLLSQPIVQAFRILVTMRRHIFGIAESENHRFWILSKTCSTQSDVAKELCMDFVSPSSLSKPCIGPLAEGDSSRRYGAWSGY